MKKICMLMVITVLFAFNAWANSIQVTTTIAPLEYFVERVGGDLVDVQSMIPQGGNPHTYEPSPSQMMKLSKADLYVKIGTEFEFEHTWIPKLVSLNKEMTVVNASEGIQEIAMAEHEDHGDHDHHHHGAGDPHTWVSVNNAMLMVRSIEKALSKFDPTNADIYQKNASQFIAELGDLNYEIRETLKPLANKAFYIYHPSWGYFAQDYGLEQVVIEQEGKEPSARDLQRIVKEAKEKGIKRIFISPEFSDKSAKVIAKEIGGEVVVIDHLGKDFISNMKKAAEAIVEK